MKTIKISATITLDVTIEEGHIPVLESVLAGMDGRSTAAHFGHLFEQQIRTTGELRRAGAQPEFTNPLLHAGVTGDAHSLLATGHAASTLIYGHNGFALRSATAQAVEPSAWTAEALASAQVRVDFGHVEPDYHYDMLDEWHACCRRHGVSDAVGNAGLKSIRTYLRAQESSLVASPA